MSIAIILADKRFVISDSAMSRLVKKILKQESASEKSVTVVYCGDREIVRLNDEFKKKSQSTDVLAFDLSDSRDDRFLGEVYVNLQMARRQAGANGVPYEEEVKRLTVHGVLHLLGYRDDTEMKRKRMWVRQESYL